MLTGESINAIDKKNKTKKKGEGEEGEDKVVLSEITDFRENHTDTTVSFTVTAAKENIDAFEEEKNGLHGKFKLSSTISIKNMTAFDKDGKIRQYKTSLEILLEFFRQRMVYYIARKDMLLHKMRRELSMLENKARFVEEVCKSKLVVSDRKRSELLADLKDHGYDLFPKDPKDEEPYEVDDENGEAEDEVMEDDTSDAELAKGYDYLLGMKIWTLTFERAKELRRQRAEKAGEVDLLESTSPEAIWSSDLDAIEELLDERDKELCDETKKQKRSLSKSKPSAARMQAKKVKKKVDDVRFCSLKCLVLMRDNPDSHALLSHGLDSGTLSSQKQKSQTCRKVNLTLRMRMTLSPLQSRHQKQS